MATDNGSGIASAAWSFFMGPHSALNVQYLHMREKNEDTPITHLGYLPPFNPANLVAMGQYTDAAQADLKIGGYQYAAAQDYRWQRSARSASGTAARSPRHADAFDRGPIGQSSVQGRDWLRVRVGAVESDGQRLGSDHLDYG